MAAMTQQGARVYIQIGRLGCQRPRRCEVSVTDAINIEQLLRGEGFDTPTALARAREVIEAAGLTHAGKQAISAGKATRVEEVLRTTLLRACGDACKRIDRGGAGRAREAVIVTSPSCEICRGSNNHRAAIEMLRTLERKHVTRIVVVGGTSNLWREIRAIFDEAPAIEVRYVDGTNMSHSAKDALANKRWAQLIVVWAPTPLQHAVSNHYRSDALPEDLRHVTVNRRGVEAFCGEVVRTYA